jgi:glycyl-tRNA synthetase beta chain
LPRLETLTFQAKLGSVGDKVRRLIQLIQQIGGDKNALRAAELSKADLMSEMVNEFPELQGIMGEYYARHQGESEDVAKALFEQYLPRFSGDKLPGTSSGKILALADRLDTLSGIFAIGLKPTGSKDPFALRRAMIGVIRLLTEGEMDFDLWALLDFALKPYETLLPKADKKAILGDLKSFALDRLKSFWLDEKKYDLVWVDAIIAKIIALDVANLKDAEQRLQALIAFGKLKEAESLLAANKRVGNLLKKNQISGDAALIQTHLFQESAEKDLFAQIQEIKPDLAKLLASNHYENYLKKLAVLRPVLDAFFESVMVMADDLAIRNNRLALLATVYELFGVIAVLSG